MRDVWHHTKYLFIPNNHNDEDVNDRPTQPNKCLHNSKKESFRKLYFGVLKDVKKSVICCTLKFEFKKIILHALIVWCQQTLKYLL